MTKIIIGILCGAAAFIFICLLLYWLIIKPGRAAAEDNFYERYINPKK